MAATTAPYYGGFGYGYNPGFYGYRGYGFGHGFHGVRASSPAAISARLERPLRGGFGHMGGFGGGHMGGFGGGHFGGFGGGHFGGGGALPLTRLA